jgi:hypothetical protein
MYGMSPGSRMVDEGIARGDGRQHPAVSRAPRPDIFIDPQAGLT